VPVPRKERERSRIGVLEVSILSLSTIVLLDLVTVTRCGIYGLSFYFHNYISIRVEQKLCNVVAVQIELFSVILKRIKI
jgi:hypothetical protein